MRYFKYIILFVLLPSISFALTPIARTDVVPFLVDDVVIGDVDD